MTRAIFNNTNCSEGMPSWCFAKSGLFLNNSGVPGTSIRIECFIGSPRSKYLKLEVIFKNGLDKVNGVQTAHLPRCSKPALPKCETSVKVGYYRNERLWQSSLVRQATSPEKACFEDSPVVSTLLRVENYAFTPTCSCFCKLGVPFVAVSIHKSSSI